MAGIAAGMLAIMLIVGRPDPPPRPAQAAAPAQTPSADRVGDYRDRLRLLEAQALRESQMAGVPQPEPVPYADSAPAPVQDPIAEERKRREYESLFASNVVLSRRPESERPDQGRITSMPGASPQTGSPSPSVDEVADAVVRASARTASALGTGAPVQAPAAPATSEPRQADPAQRRTPEYTPPISAAGPLHRVLEGTVIDTVLTNRLDGAMAAPVNCLVTNALYSHTGRQVIVPAGARILGETKPVQAFGETRLAVSFHRLLMPDGRSYRLDQFMGLNQTFCIGIALVPSLTSSIFSGQGGHALMATAEEWAAIRDIQEHLPQAHVVLRHHQLLSRRHQGVPSIVIIGALVTLKYGPFVLRREYIVSDKQAASAAATEVDRH
jgi:type IV secretion system protein VirB10